MTRLLDCLVSYFGLDENERPGFQRYFCYHILAGPGPTAGAGVAVIGLLAAHSVTESCDSCQQLFHTVESGGPEMAMAAAVLHLDTYHKNDHMRKVQSNLRRCDGDQGRQSAPSLRPFPGSGDFVRK